MRRPFRARSYVLVAAIGVGAVAVALFVAKPDLIFDRLPTNSTPDRPAATRRNVSDTDQPVVVIDEKGMGQLKVGTVDLREFKQEIRDVGVVDFNEDASAPVFPAYQGKIIKALVDLGDRVEKDQVLYTIDSPDLVQSEATFIQTAGVLELTTRNLGRLLQSVKNGGGAQKDLDQARADLQTATGAYNAAKQALGIFGKTDSEIDRIASSRVVDPILVVRSPIAGTITTRNAAPGVFVQPGTAPAPYSVADLARVRLYDFVSEDESPVVRLGAAVTGRVSAYPDRVFTGKVTAIAAAVDASTHRLRVETLIPNSNGLLRPSMFADIAIQTGEPVRSPAVPATAVVRLGNGDMTVWVALQDQRFVQRLVKLGMQQDGYDQVVAGVKAGDRIVTDGAVFVSNVATANASP